MQAVIINIGDELLIGQVVNTNASWMAAQLELENIHVKRIITIGDSQQEIVRFLDQNIGEVDLVLLTGGLGPTKDDMTKHCLATYFNSPLVNHQETFLHVEQYFASRNLPFSDINRQQAMVPACCTPILNKVGTASGMWFEQESTIVVSLPGVPFEMKWLMQHHVLPLLKERRTGHYILHKTILTYGIGESFLAEKIAAWEDALPQGFHLAYLPASGKVRLRLSGQAANQSALEQTMNQEIEKLLPLIKPYIYGFDNQSLPEVIGEHLKTQGMTLSTAESCTGGCLAHRITEIPGASHYYLGGAITYSNEMKHKLLGVTADTLEQHGAVSQETAMQMAQGCKAYFGTHYAIATTGIAGPDGGTEQKPTGTVWIAIATPHSLVAEKYCFNNPRAQHQERTTNQALFNLLKIINETYS